MSTTTTTTQENLSAATPNTAEADAKAACEARTPVRIVFFGASTVSKHVCDRIAGLGFQVDVVDCDPDAFARHSFGGCAFHLVDFDRLDEAGLDLGKDDMACILTRTHAFDPQSFAFALASPAFYVGMMGSASKNADCFAYARAHGCSEERIASAFAPIGLDIGASDAGEIGLAIAAQLVKERNVRFPRGKDYDSFHTD